MSLEGKAAPGYELKGKLAGLKTIHGYSAYEVAVINGFEGTEEEWLESLRGYTGEDGKSAYDAACEYGYEGTEEEFYADFNLFEERAEIARTSAASAEASASAAATSAGAAQASASAAQSSESAASAAQAAAEKARDEAQAVAGGDFASPAYVDTKAASAESNAKAYTDTKIAAIPTPDVSGQINTHNTNKSAHSDIRSAITNGVSEAKSYTDTKIAAIPTPDVSGQIGTHNASATAHSDIRSLVSTAQTTANNAASAASAAQTAANEAKASAGYSKAETITNDTKALFGLGGGAVPNDAFAKIGLGGMNYIPTTVPDEIIFDEWKEYSNFPVDTASYNICDLQYIDGAYYLLVQGKSSPYTIKLFKSEDKGNSWGVSKTLWEPVYVDHKADRIFGVRGKICVTTCGASGSGIGYSRVYTMNSFDDEPVYKQIQDHANSVSRYFGFWRMANGYLFLISNTTTTPKMYAYNPETDTVLQSGGFNGPSGAYMYDVCHYKDNIYLLSVKGSQGAPNVYRMTLDFASSTFSFTPYSYIKSGGGWFIPVGDDILEVEWNSSSGFNGLYKITSVTESGYDEERLITNTQIGEICSAFKYRGKTLLFARAVKINDDKTAAYALVELSDDLKSFTVIKEYPDGMYSYFGRRTQVNYWPSFEPESVLTYSFWHYVNSSKVDGLAYTANTYKVIPKIVDYHGADVVLPSAQLDFGGKIAVGSYIGTNTYGAGKDTVLSFDFAPKAVMIYATRHSSTDTNKVYNFLGGGNNASNEMRTMGIYMDNIGTSYNPQNTFLYDGSNLQATFFKKSADGKTLYIYSASSATMQMNSAYTYVYIALG